VLQHLTGSTKPFGSCVNLAHRLLKNEVTDRTGWRAYALFTDRALDGLGVKPEGLHTESTSYPHLGECEISAMNLHTRYEELIAQRTSFLSAEQAHYSVRRRFSIPPSRVWDLVTDARLRNGWDVGANWTVVNRPSGRSGPGASNHCSNSGFIEEVLDWRRFDYYTVVLRYGTAIRFRVTGELIPDGEETELRWSMALESFLPTPLRGPACRFFARRLLRAPVRFDYLDRMIEGEARTGGAAPA
jgi:hypothetical protein